MTKKKTTKKKTVKKIDAVEKPVDPPVVFVCERCVHFRINGEGARRGRCHRYPSSTPTEINHFCGEFK